MIPLSKSKIKYIKSLHLKKNRQLEGKFIVEGNKSVLEYLRSDFEVGEVVCTDEFYQNIDADLLPATVVLASKNQLANVGNFKSNNAALAIVKIKDKEKPLLEDDEIIIALDNINDPGNLGTIIRIADWYGIGKLLLSNDSVDIYNPKVVSASKGSMTRVKLYYVDLVPILSTYKGMVYAAELDGEPIKNVDTIQSGIILMGSETHGISKGLSPYISQKVTIVGEGGAESLNVAVATGIIVNHLVA